MSASPQETPGSLFSLDDAMLARILEHAGPPGHHEGRGCLNLGFGFLYYGLARTVRPAHVVVIGSGFGFSVVCLALALKDNGLGALSFVDPSCSMHWGEAEHVRAHFDRFGVADVVTHFKMTSGEFFGRCECRSLGAIDVAFIDGNHSVLAGAPGFHRHVMRHARKYEIGTVVVAWRPSGNDPAQRGPRHASTARQPHRGA
jgi:predicted O-methyltransferase YrrM